MISRDALFGGKVAFEQPARGAGYRVNVDAILLAAFAARANAGARVAFDLGAGAGGVALSLLHLEGAKRVVMVEIDPRAAAMAESNLAANGWSDRGEVLVGDARTVARARRGEAHLVLCNPPYFETGRGRAPREPSRAAARSGELRVFVDAAHALLGRRARACFVYPARELVTLLATLRGAGLEPKRIRFVHASPSTPARVALVESMHAKAGGLVIEPPLFEREADARGENGASVYSAELATLLAGR